jgi:hypothetical protein
MRAASPTRGAPAFGTARSAIATRASAVAPTLTTTTAVARIRGILLRPRHQIDNVEKLTPLLRASRCGFALDHAYQANLGHAPAHHIERLHQSAEPVAFQLESGAHGFRLGPRTQINRRRWLGWRFWRACADAGFGAGFGGRGLVAWRGGIRRSL